MKKNSVYTKMAAAPLSMTDLLYLYKPGQLPDLVSMLQKSLSEVKSATFSVAPKGDIIALGPAIINVRTKALAAGVINTAGPNVAKINATLAKYATIPAILSGYAQPAVITDEQLAKDNDIFGPILTYLDKALDDLCNSVVYLVIQDNMNTTDAAKIDAIKNLILAFLTCINDTASKIKIPTTILHPNFGEISSRLAEILSKKLGVTITPPNAITWQDMYILGDMCPNYIAIALRTSLTAIVTAKTIDKYKSPKNIQLIKSIPSLVEAVVTLSDDPFVLNYLPKFSTTVFPIPEPTLSLFTGLTLDNYSTNVSQLPAGIMNYLITSTLGTLSSGLFKYLTTLQERVIHRGFQNFDQVNLVTAKCVLTLKAYVKMLNTIINIFQIKLKDNPANLKYTKPFNDLSKKNGFVVNEMPTASGGKRKRRSKKSGRRRTLKRRVKNLTPK